MKITSKMLSITPYVSTSWKNILTLNTKEEAGVFALLLILKDGHRVIVPNLERREIDLIFNAHAKYAHATFEESEEKVLLSEIPLDFIPPLKEGNRDVLATIQHNPDQSDLPPLPPGILNKISAIALSFGTEALQNLPKAEVNCSCVYCQLMRAIHGETEIEEEITEEDLRFRNWDIEQKTDKLFIVKNPIEPNEHYNVFLGEPIGCTCGSKNCEHISAVLKT